MAKAILFFTSNKKLDWTKLIHTIYAGSVKSIVQLQIEKIKKNTCSFRKNENQANKRRYIIWIRTSLEDMWASWFLGPFRAKNDPIIKAHPRVKHIANFWGISTMTGRNMKNATKIKNTPLARRRPKYMSAFPEGTLLVAVWKLPGNSLTPLDTLVMFQQYKSLIIV